jgi:hypothetical protein
MHYKARRIVASIPTAVIDSQKQSLPAFFMS